MPWIIKPCEFCNNEFRSQSWKGYERRFCSCSCKQKHSILNEVEKFPWIKNGKRMAKCRECGKDYWQRHTDKYFCNNECYLIWKRRKARNKLIPAPHKLNSDNGRHYKRLKKFKTTMPQICEKCNSSLKVQVHHINGDPFHNPSDGSNWMKLCHKCHLWVHRQGRKCGHYLSRDEIISMTYEPYIRIRKKVSN